MLTKSNMIQVPERLFHIDDRHALVLHPPQFCGLLLHFLVSVCGVLVLCGAISW